MAQNSPESVAPAQAMKGPSLRDLLGRHNYHGTFRDLDDVEECFCLAHANQKDRGVLYYPSQCEGVRFWELRLLKISSPVHPGKFRDDLLVRLSSGEVINLTRLFSGASFELERETTRTTDQSVSRKRALRRAKRRRHTGARRELARRELARREHAATRLRAAPAVEQLQTSETDAACAGTPQRRLSTPRSRPSCLSRGEQ